MPLLQQDILGEQIILQAVNQYVSLLMVAKTKKKYRKRIAKIKFLIKKSKKKAIIKKNIGRNEMIELLIPLKSCIFDLNLRTLYRTSIQLACFDYPFTLIIKPIWKTRRMLVARRQFIDNLKCSN